MKEFEDGLYLFEYKSNLDRQRLYKQWYCRNESDMNDFLERNKFNAQLQDYELLMSFQDLAESERIKNENQKQRDAIWFLT